MKNMLLPVAALLLASCASMAPESSPAKPSNLPGAMTTPSPASTEGSLTKSLQDSLDAMRQDLAESLGRARVSPPTSAPAKLGR